MLGSHAQGCWHPKTFEKAVVIIIDALRYDFTVPFVSSPGNPQPHHYHNGITALYETAVEQPNNAFLRPFIADPPTTTLVRLKGLTTGTLPTFLDAGSNFAGTAIDEDNIVGQLNAAGRRVVHLGDDTWQALFPDSFDKNLTRAYDSFNVWDLHSVDNGVNEHLMPLLQPGNSSKWDVIFGHYLGVDHAGHRYGPDHPAMAAKLKQMDTVVRDIIRLLDDDTLLVIMGDHGMDGKGDHGGESDDEVQAALWMYSKQPVFGRSRKEFATPPATAKERPVNQIDLVPTLSLLLGLPIPFNNLGGPIEEAFIGKTGGDYANLAAVNHLTASQIWRYQLAYASFSKRDVTTAARSAELFAKATLSWVGYVGGYKNASQADWHSLAETFAAYQASNLATCKALWARFDLVSIGAGVVVLLLTLMTFINLIGALQGDSIAWIREPTGPGALLLLSFCVAGFSLSQMQEKLTIDWPLSPSTSFRIFLFLAAIFYCFHTMSKSTQSVSLPKSAWSWMLVLFVLLQSAGFGSNSFTIWEDEILLLFLSTAGILFIAQSLRLQTAEQRRHGIWHSVIFLVAIRVAAMSRLCREEQMPWGRSTYYASATSSTSAPWQLAVSWVVALVLPDAIKSYYTLTHSYQGSLPIWLGVAFRISILLIAVFWTLDAADDGEWFVGISKETLKTVRMYVAQFVLCLAAGAGTATFAYMSPCIGISTWTPPNRSAVTPAKGLSKKSPEPVPEAQRRPQIVVQGTKNLYGSHYATLPLTVLLIPLLLVQKPMGQGALALVVVAIFSMLEVIHLLSETPSPPKAGRSTAKSARPHNTANTTTALGPVLLALLGHFAYFKTGHQATLASLQWDSAFIPLRTIRYPWSPLLVIMNTFAGPILCAAAVPATVLWRRPYSFKADTEDAPDAGGVVISPPSSPNKSALNQNGSSKVQVSSNGASDAAQDQKQQVDSREMERNYLLTEVTRAHITHILVYATYSLATTVLAGHLRRHLMLYRVFCPRWMLGSAMLIIAEVVGILVGVGGTRWTVGSVGGLFGW